MNQGVTSGTNSGQYQYSEPCNYFRQGENFTFLTASLNYLHHSFSRSFPHWGHDVNEPSLCRLLLASRVSAKIKPPHQGTRRGDRVYSTEYAWVTWAKAARERTTPSTLVLQIAIALSWMDGSVDR